MRQREFDNSIWIISDRECMRVVFLYSPEGLKMAKYTVFNSRQINSVLNEEMSLAIEPIFEIFGALNIFYKTRVALRHACNLWKTVSNFFVAGYF